MKIDQPSSILKQNFSVASAKLSGKKGKKKSSSGEGPRGKIFCLSEPTSEIWARIVAEHSPAWQLKGLLEKPRDLLTLTNESGPVILLQRRKPKGPFSHSGQLEDSDYGWFREQGGSIWSLIKSSPLVEFELHLGNLNEEQVLGLLVGFELAAYQFKAEFFGKRLDAQPSVVIIPPAKSKLDADVLEELLEQAQTAGTAVNWARHLVNLPPNELNPSTASELAKKRFGGRHGMTVEIWNEQRLQKENMGLILGVGAGSPDSPCLIHLRYRPGKKSKKMSPIAFVGKGITFDTGGLDIKPSSGMRLMKKDMGGSAAVLALAWWVSEAKYEAPVDFYLAVAENSVDGKSMRPSDVLTSRSGQTVEIHNTDAEGRLVLADALDVATTAEGNDAPEFVIDIATLTGAIKTALGTEISGLFSNHDALADQLQKAGHAAGELSWRMPLFSRYTSSFSSPFADMVNAVDGWAGPITAALFLEKFVHQKPWAHFDMYAWNDKPSGTHSFAGGSGQCVQTMIQFMQSRVTK